MSVLALKAIGILIPDAVHFTAEWIYRSSAALNGLLYVALHSCVRRELRRYLTARCRRNTVAPAAIQPVGNGGRQRHRGIVNTDAGAHGAPATTMTSSCQRVNERLATTNLWCRCRSRVIIVDNFVVGLSAILPFSYCDIGKFIKLCTSATFSLTKNWLNFTAKMR